MQKMRSSRLLANKPGWQDFAYSLPKRSPPPNIRKTEARIIKDLNRASQSQYDYNNNFLNDQPQRSRKSLQLPAPKWQPIADGRNQNISYIPHKVLAQQSEQEHFEKLVKRRNLEVSRPLRKGPKLNVVPFPEFISETHDAYRVPGERTEKRSLSLPIRHSGYKTMLDLSSTNENPIPYQKAPRMIEPVFHKHKIDLDTTNAVAKLYDMRGKIMAGSNVSMTDITRLRGKLGVHHHDTFETRTHRRRRMVMRRPLFCDKGIVYVPTPHTKLNQVNSFGTPADLRISLSGTDNQESNRRRFTFDYRGFLDSDIKIYLEGTRRLLIRGERPERGYEKPALKITDFIDLPRDLPVDNLRMVRDVFGGLIVEEAWKFA